MLGSVVDTPIITLVGDDDELVVMTGELLVMIGAVFAGLSNVGIFEMGAGQPGDIKFLSGGNFADKQLKDNQEYLTDFVLVPSKPELLLVIFSSGQSLTNPADTVSTSCATTPSIF